MRTRNQGKLSIDEQLVLAAVHGTVKKAKRLIDEGANVNYDASRTGKSPLYTASENGKVHVVELLIDKGADIDCIGCRNGDGPLHVASKKGYLDVVRLLVAKGASIDLKTYEKDENTALQYASYQGHEKVVEFLLDNGACIDAKSRINMTALCMAIMGGRFSIVMLLMEKGADMGLTDPNGVSALSYASFTKKVIPNLPELPKVIEYLSKKEAYWLRRDQAYQWLLGMCIFKLKI